jgi:transposase
MTSLIFAVHFIETYNFLIMQYFLYLLLDFLILIFIAFSAISSPTLKETSTLLPLSLISESEALEKVKKASITGREGFFCLTSSENLTLKDAVNLYREKDSIEKIMHSLKNEICIKPLRVWTTKSIYGAILIGYLAQLIISLIRYDNPNLKKLSTKSIKISLMNLTVTIEKTSFWKKRRIYSNFDPINELICLQNEAKT